MLYLFLFVHLLEDFIYWLLQLVSALLRHRLNHPLSTQKLIDAKAVLLIDLETVKNQVFQRLRNLGGWRNNDFLSGDLLDEDTVALIDGKR